MVDTKNKPMTNIYGNLWSTRFSILTHALWEGNYNHSSFRILHMLISYFITHIYKWWQTVCNISKCIQYNVGDPTINLAFGHSGTVYTTHKHCDFDYGLWHCVYQIIPILFSLKSTACTHLPQHPSAQLDWWLSPEKSLSACHGGSK